MEAYSLGSHPDYRLFMSAEPSPTREGHIIPQGILEVSIKITNEPPTGMMANVHKALDNFNQVFDESSLLFFSLLLCQICFPLQLFNWKINYYYYC